MALNTEEIIAVIAGSVAGLVVLLLVIAIILYLCIGRRRRDNRSKQKQFAHRHLTPDTSLSKNSGLQHGDQRGHSDPRMDTRIDPRLDPRVDPRLPKVGSSNLWFGTPSLYTSGPSPVYQDMRKKGHSKHQPQEPGSFQAPPHGHMVYQANMGGRIYHSQQVVPSPYPNEYRLPRTGSYMDIYSYPYSYDPYKDMNNLESSRAMLMEYPQSSEYYMDPYREREVRRTGKKVRRANSDLTQHSTRRPKVRKQRGETPFERQSSREDMTDGPRQNGDVQHEKTKHRHSEDRHNQGGHVTRADVHRSKKQAPPPPTQKSKTEPTDPELTESATDSAKLRAIERERAREKEKALYVTTTQVISDYSRDNPGYIHDEQRSKDESDLHVRTYNYEGKPSKYENSVIAKMAAMVETPKATLVPANKGGCEVNKDIFNMQGTTTSSTESFHAEVTKKLEKLKEKGGALNPGEGPVATSTGKNSRSSRPTSARARRSSSGVDADGNAITAEAFEFLDGYSDGEGTDFLGSGAITPTQMRDYDVTF